MKSGPAWTIDHIGHAASDLEAAVEFYRTAMGFSVELRETLEREAVDVVFLKDTNGALIELIAPRPGNSNLQKFLSSRGPGLHHVCYRVPAVLPELERLKSAGISLIDAVPRTGSRGLQVAFLHPKSCNGVLVELCSAA